MKQLALVDHIIISIDVLERGIDLLEEATGVRAVYGGAHPGRGTHNALLSLGNNQYIELLSRNPGDTSEAVRSSASQLMAHYGQFKTLTPTGWAMRVTDADAERARLVGKGFNASAVRPGSRAKPDGQMLTWKTFNPWGIGDEMLPFAIEWGAGTQHPSVAAPPGCKLTDFAIVSSSPSVLAALFRKAEIPMKIKAGAKDHLELTLDCPRGRVHLPS